MRRSGASMRCGAVDTRAPRRGAVCGLQMGACSFLKQLVEFGADLPTKPLTLVVFWEGSSFPRTGLQLDTGPCPRMNKTGSPRK